MFSGSSFCFRASSTDLMSLKAPPLAVILSLSPLTNRSCLLVSAVSSGQSIPGVSGAFVVCSASYEHSASQVGELVHVLYAKTQAQRGCEPQLGHPSLSPDVHPTSLWTGPRLSHPYGTCGPS